jgi:hypothetical protein
MDPFQGWREGFFTDDCRATEYEGLGIDEARFHAALEGERNVRVIEARGDRMITFDHLPTRLNLLTDDGVVILAGRF